MFVETPCTHLDTISTLPSSLRQIFVEHSSTAYSHPDIHAYSHPDIYVYRHIDICVVHCACKSHPDIHAYSHPDVHTMYAIYEEKSCTKIHETVTEKSANVDMYANFVATSNRKISQLGLEIRPIKYVCRFSPSCPICIQI